MKHVNRIMLVLLMIQGSQSCSKLFESYRYHVDFDEVMEFTKKDRWHSKRQKKQKKPLTQFCKKLYEKNNLQKIEPQEEPIIPKKIHLIWVGPKTPPPILNSCIESVKKHLPDWEFKLWTDEDIPHLTLENQKYYDEEENYGAKADILRYELLYQFGGVYLDIDFILLKPFDIFNHTYEFYTSLMPSYNKDIVSNGVIGSIPGHPILKHCMEAVKHNRHHEWVVRRTGPLLFEKSFYHITKKLPDHKIVAFPKSFFIPLDKNQKWFSPEKEAHLLKPESFAVHYWASTWNDNLKHKRRHRKLPHT